MPYWSESLTPSATATFSQDRLVNWIVFGVLLLFGLLPGVVYFGFIAATPSRTTILAMLADTGTWLAVESDGKGDAAMLEGWIRGNLVRDSRRWWALLA